MDISNYDEVKKEYEELRAKAHKEAKERIFECLSKIDGKIYPSEIAELLHINYELCIEVIEELLKEGKIGVEEG